MSGTEQLACPSCGNELVESPASDMDHECPRCHYTQRTPKMDLPPCWKESRNADERGIERLFVHLDGPGFIGVEDGTAELVTADLKNDEKPDPVTRDATPDNIRELAESYNDEFYGNGHSVGPGIEQSEGER